MGVQSADVAAAILEGLAGASGALALSDLARRVGMPPAKVHRYMVSLARSRLVAQDPATGHYGVGPAAIALGLAGLRAANPVREAMQALTRLRDVTGETAILVLWTRAGPVVAAIEESSRPVYMNIRVGSLLPTFDSATGRVFAAWLPPKETARWKRDRDPTRTRAGLEKIRRDGYARVSGATVPGVSAAAAPVFEVKGPIAAVLGVIGSDRDFAAGAGKRIALAVRNIAAEVSAKLGFRLPDETGKTMALASSGRRRDRADD